MPPTTDKVQDRTLLYYDRLKTKAASRLILQNLITLLNKQLCIKYPF